MTDKLQAIEPLLVHLTEALDALKNFQDYSTNLMKNGVLSFPFNKLNVYKKVNGGYFINVTHKGGNAMRLNGELILQDLDGDQAFYEFAKNELLNCVLQAFGNRFKVVNPTAWRKRMHIKEYSYDIEIRAPPVQTNSGLSFAKIPFNVEYSRSSRTKITKDQICAVCGKLVLT